MKADEKPRITPGQIVLFGSGETSPSGRKVFEQVLREIPPEPRVALLETPAGFELNSAQVIRRVVDFLEHNLQNYHPQTAVVAARQRGTEYSPDNPEIVQPLLDADLIFMGPGSPTYAVRQLRDSLAWHYLMARHRLGSALVLASAAVVAVSAQALPVYEIYKAGDDLHWKPGLDLLGPYGLQVVFVPHWDNTDGGDELDTSRCFMGQARFDKLLALLPPGNMVVGIDEKTALFLNIATGEGRVMGKGGVTLLRSPLEKMPAVERYLSESRESRESRDSRDSRDSRFSLSEWGLLKNPAPGAGIPADVWNKAIQATGERTPADPPEAVLGLVAARETARLHKDWPAADRLRKEISDLGWNAADGPDGPIVTPK